MSTHICGLRIGLDLLVRLACTRRGSKCKSLQSVLQHMYPLHLFNHSKEYICGLNNVSVYWQE